MGLYVGSNDGFLVGETDGDLDVTVIAAQQRVNISTINITASRCRFILTGFSEAICALYELALNRSTKIIEHLIYTHGKILLSFHSSPFPSNKRLLAMDPKIITLFCMGINSVTERETQRLLYICMYL